jgi:hypothetical protein
MARPILEDDGNNNKDKMPVNHIVRGICYFILLNFLMIAVPIILIGLYLFFYLVIAEHFFQFFN